jgi:hypothetical protein
MNAASASDKGQGGTGGIGGFALGMSLS